MLGERGLRVQLAPGVRWGPLGSAPGQLAQVLAQGSDGSLRCPNETQAPRGVSLTAARAPGPDPQTLTDMQEATRACPQEDGGPRGSRFPGQSNGGRAQWPRPGIGVTPLFSPSITTSKADSSALETGGWE